METLQLLALRLELLCLPLGFFQQILKLDPVVCGSHGYANRFGHLVEQRQSGGIEGMVEAELNHRVGQSINRRLA